MSGTFAVLEDRSVIRISGEDKGTFMQGLITADISRLGNETAIYALILTPQGKYLFDFFIVKVGDDFLLETNKQRTPELIKKLTMYKLRSKVTITPEENFSVLWSTEQLVGISFKDPRNGALGFRTIAPSIDLENIVLTKIDAVEYDKKRISLRIPEGEKDLIAEKSFPLHFGLDALGAIDFDKGCYVGQEVTARTKHMGVIRKKIYLVEGTAQLPPAGIPVKAGEAAIGEMCSSSRNLGLALLRTEETQKALSAAAAITAEGTEIISLQTV